jgi:hypothetical protein
VRGETYIAAVGGAIALCVTDLVTNAQAATLLKLGAAGEMFFGSHSPGLHMLGLLLTLGVAAFLVWLRQPTSRESAFLLGVSTFTVLSIGAPYSALQNKPGTAQPGADISVPEARITPNGNETSLLDLFVGSVYAAQAEVPSPPPAVAYATVVWKEVAISSCKPEYLGPLGLTSFFTNRLRFCAGPERLKYPERVEVLDCWTSGLRNYRYVEVAYERGGVRKTGWIPDGQVPKVWVSVRPDPNAQMPAGCR